MGMDTSDTSTTRHGTQRNEDILTAIFSNADEIQACKEAFVKIEHMFIMPSSLGDWQRNHIVCLMAYVFPESTSMISISSLMPSHTSLKR
jgi:hypothetical protein